MGSIISWFNILNAYKQPSLLAQLSALKFQLVAPFPRIDYVRASLKGMGAQ
ncbi:MAG: hypothetical protein DSM106950_21295 [Stigonema ocellatum SAG 48.90 = DSM 106950]|nr:hypothetical protein [Stigonema ocellatum SAG 48.90 = DSM 106950]